MAKKIVKISIPDNLTPVQEAEEIRNRLNQKALSGKGYENFKRIGEGIEIKDAKTIIEITRKPSEPYITTKSCTVCECSYQSDMGVKIWVNYGGVVKSLVYCSKKCCDAVIDICGPGRAAYNRKKLKPVNNYFK